MATKKTATKTAAAKPAKAAKKAPAKKAAAAKPQPKAKPAPKAKGKTDFASMTLKEMKANRPAKSTVERPVLFMWDLCDKMVGKPRKDVIAAALTAGVTYNTACWQYQAWKTAYNNSK